MGQFGAIRPVMIYFQTRRHQTAENNVSLLPVSACASLILHNKSTKAETETKGSVLKHLYTSAGRGAAPARRAHGGPSGAPVIGQRRAEPPRGHRQW